MAGRARRRTVEVLVLALAFSLLAGGMRPALVASLSNSPPPHRRQEAWFKEARGSSGVPLKGSSFISLGQTTAAAQGLGILDASGLASGAGTSLLLPGDALDTGSFLVAEDRSCHTVMQNDGNLCVYTEAQPSDEAEFLWCSSSSGAEVSDFSAQLGRDGRLAVWRRGGSEAEEDEAQQPAEHAPLWTSMLHDGCLHRPGSSFVETEVAEGAYSLKLFSKGRLSILRRVGNGTDGREVWSNGLGTFPPAPELEKPKYIFFERDRAGFNNIRLQLASMVAIAAVTGRTLVLPPPDTADHLGDSLFYEFDFFDATKLTQAIPVSLSGKPDRDTLRVEQELAKVDVRQLPEDRHWFFPMWNSRIQHFECLKLNKHDKAVAAHAVLTGLTFDRHLEEMASVDLHTLGLAHAAFDCVHIRRGDFKQFSPNSQRSDADLSELLRPMLNGSHRPVLVVSDERPELDLGTPVVLAQDAYGEGVSSETRVAVDMIMCSRAKAFVGSPGSTFTNGIAEQRRRLALLEGEPPMQVRLYTDAPELEGQGLCWNKQTSFLDVQTCDEGARAGTCTTFCTL